MFFSTHGKPLGRRIFSVAAALLAICASAHSQAPDAAFDEQIKKGAEAYGMSCAMCHYEGAGSATAPDLKGSPIFKEPPATLIGVILKGRNGVSVVNGRKFNGIMPPQAFLSDADIAAIVAYTRQTFGDEKTAVTPAEVKALRTP